MSKEKIKDIWKKYKTLIISGGVLIIGGTLLGIKIRNKLPNNAEPSIKLDIETEEFDKFFIVMDSDLNKGSYEHMPITNKSFEIIRKDTFEQMKEHGIDPNAFESMDIFIGLNPKKN